MDPKDDIFFQAGVADIETFIASLKLSEAERELIGRLVPRVLEHSMELVVMNHTLIPDSARTRSMADFNRALMAVAMKGLVTAGEVMTVKEGKRT